MFEEEGVKEGQGCAWKRWVVDDITEAKTEIWRLL